MYLIMHKVKTVCGWCNKPISTTLSTVPNPHTHGICSTCQASLNAQAQAIQRAETKGKS